MQSLRGVIFLGAVFLGEVLAAQSPAFAAQPFDGTWSVEVVTEKGDCDRAYRWDLTIADGHIATTADMPARASGAVSKKGAVSVQFQSGSDSLSATGTASGKWATGTWASPSRSCSGRWRAERRG